MLSLRKISLTHFKNYDLSSFDFTSNVVGICGLNGKGKTNLLDAIYYCCFTKSYFTATELLNIGFDKEGFRLEGRFEKGGDPQKVICIHRGTGKKEISLNDSGYDKVSKHIGLLPSVMIAPDDIEIIVGGSEGRRKYIDTILCQLDTDYLQQLMTYNKVLQQRNSLLKRFAEQGKTDEALLDILNLQLSAPGKYVFEKRRSFTEELKPVVQQLYHRLASNAETVSVDYDSRLLTETFEEIFLRNRDKDRVLQRTNGGIHKDDLRFELNGQPFKSIASQGQRKSLLFALKLAEFQLIKKYKGFSPILLLDDVFEKLDAARMQQLLHWVCVENQGQVFITDTHRQRLEVALKEIEVGFQIIELV
ncbi:DNA replication/repair protein RecF [Ferruginibacter sp. HRS2-29]|uniref:DNA replication/repair protein RecF n=1 Tax=Ferruginibacter sp. HRS2-29 TaxID=2487334 RepID=UPI0020CEBF81|nr:DNA replication and repair protein RecF [Ferruginibacter sp. HRS2-29]MCP9751348.1 DNA replication and repair protein RecF [Ferruginibacter sp. HRS2-29]